MTSQLPATPMSDFAQKAAQHHKPQSRIEGGYLKFNGKTGHWSLGLEETPVEDEECLINVSTMMHGWQRWGELPPAKVLVPITDPMPDQIDPLEGVDQEGRAKTFVSEHARQVSGKFIEDDLGQFIFNTSSMGGVERMDDLFAEVIRKASDGTPYCFPRVRLESDFYKRSTGKVYKPVFKLVAWCDVNGKAQPDKALPPAGDDDDTMAPDDEAKPTRRRRRRS